MTVETSFAPGAAPIFGRKKLAQSHSLSLAFRLSFVAICLVLSFLAASPTLAARGVPIPGGFLMLCMEHPSECKGGGAASVSYSDALLAKLQQVNASVNAAIRPIKNEKVDVWSINVSQGDCEEYVLAKRRQLIRSGIPASALSIVYALRNGGGHAILAIHTDKGDLVLDNMAKAIKPITRTGYRIVSMSGPDPMVWHRP